jgi:nucleoside-diphosphate-sugar epimerase
LRVLVTGASGFLGARVVDALVRRGHEVRALLRAGSRAELPEGVEPHRGDLRERGAADAAVRGVDVVVHLAAQVQGSEESRFSGTVVATENLLSSMAVAGVQRLVLASSYSVYDWSRIHRELDERAAVVTEPALYERDGYTVAKVWQERVARRAADGGELSLTVLRPGYIHGPGNELVDGGGVRLGRMLLVVGPLGTLPLVHVDSCAERFAAAVEAEAAEGATLNVVDPDPVRTWRYVADADPTAFRVPVPYSLGLAVVRALHALARGVLGERMRVPSIFVPRRFEARFKPVRTDVAEMQRVLGP